jgi:hypothetical protein
MAIKIGGDTVISDSKIGTLINLELSGTSAMKIPVGTTAQRPVTLEPGHLRFNTDTNQLEGYGVNNQWQAVGAGADDAFVLALIGL